MLKTFAALSLSACVLVGGAIPSFAASTGDSRTAQYATCASDENIDCDYAKFKVKNADGSTWGVQICSFCGDSSSGELSRVTGASSNFSSLYLYQGTLDNGMKVLSINFGDAAEVEYLSSEDGEASDELTIKDQARWENDITATITVPKELVEGYTLMRVNADGSESPVEVSVGSRNASFKVLVEDGACLVHLVANAD